MYTGHTWLKIWRAVYVCVLFFVEVLGRRTRNLTTIERDEDGLRSWLGIRLLAYNEGLFLSGSFFFLTGTKIVLRAVSGRSAVASRWLRCAEPSSLSWILLLKHRWSRIHILPFALFSFALKLIAYIYHLSFIYNLSVYISFHTPRPTKTTTEKRLLLCFDLLLLHPPLDTQTPAIARQKQTTTEILSLFCFFCFFCVVSSILQSFCIVQHTAWQCAFLIFFYKHSHIISFTQKQHPHSHIWIRKYKRKKEKKNS
jgi:hypothetical protein